MHVALTGPFASRAFFSCEENVNRCVSCENENIAILEALFYLTPLVFFSSGSLPTTKS